MAGQAIYVPADDLTDPAPATTIAHLDATPPLCCLARRPKKGSITSVQAIYVPADALTDPAPATTVAHLDATTVAHLDATTVAHLDATTVAHLDATTVAHLDATTFAHLDATTFAHLDATTVAHLDATTFAHLDATTVLSRQVSHPFTWLRCLLAGRLPFSPYPVSSLHTRTTPYTTLSPSQGVLDGKYDDLPEQGQAFYRVGGIEEVVVVAKAEKLAKELSS
ncbi:unnamed protein product [Closterium sp. Yama58-4]|nr:unnamed protein product [Closterium sp. Yama58-4]